MPDRRNLPGPERFRSQQRIIESALPAEAGTVREHAAAFRADADLRSYNGTRPGSPTPRAMVADDDLALGRIVEGVTRSRFWASTLVLVVEDDAQNGLDHVDGHRTVALAIGPHIRHGVVDSNFYNHSSMIRTIQDIFRIPPQTRFVAAARPMTSLFMAGTDTKTYTARKPNVAFDEMNPPLKALQGRPRWAAQQSLTMNWHDPDDVPSDVLNRILWWSSKGYDKEYPQATGKNAKTRDNSNY
ncbi:MAG: hypothetical protein QOJ99_5789 [Bryobacterales bacterium]|nr:hypothetical protein [Bryobacterales bacterium]